MCECIEIHDCNEAKAEFACRLVKGDIDSALGIAQSIWAFFRSADDFRSFKDSLISTAEAILPAQAMHSLKQDLQGLRLHTAEDLLAIA